MRWRHKPVPGRGRSRPLSKFATKPPILPTSTPSDEFLSPISPTFVPGLKHGMIHRLALQSSKISRRNSLLKLYFCKMVAAPVTSRSSSVTPLRALSVPRRRGLYAHQLIGGRDSFSCAAAATRCGGGKTGARAFANKVALELCEGAEHVENETIGVTIGIRHTAFTPTECANFVAAVRYEPD